jgi:hypothetical protein
MSIQILDLKNKEGCELFFFFALNQIASSPALGFQEENQKRNHSPEYYQHAQQANVHVIISLFIPRENIKIVNFIKYYNKIDLLDRSSSC